MRILVGAMLLFGCGSLSPSAMQRAGLECGPFNNYTCDGPGPLLCYYGEQNGKEFGRCLLSPDGTAGGDGGTTQTDMADPYAWDSSAKPGPAPGCASNSGYRLSATLYACPGMFDSTTVNKQCASGWMRAKTLTIPESACASVPWGFFAGDAHGLTMSATIDASARCDWQAPSMGWSYANRLGCGPVGRVWAGAQGNKVYTFAASNKCGGFPVVARCSGPNWSSSDTPWNCDPTALPYTESQFPQSTALAYMMDGTLCSSQ